MRSMTLGGPWTRNSEGPHSNEFILVWGHVDQLATPLISCRLYKMADTNFTLQIIKTHSPKLNIRKNISETKRFW